MKSAASLAVGMLLRRGETVAVAEVSAGGLISASLAGERGGVYVGGFVVPDVHRAQALTGPTATAPEATAQHALELARAVRSKLGSTWAVGESGVAGPTPNRRGVQPGVCALAVVGPEAYKRTTMLWPDTELSAADAYGQPPAVVRDARMAEFSEGALELLRAALEEHETAQ